MKNTTTLPLNNNNQKAFFLFLNTVHQACLWADALPRFNNDRQRVMLNQFKLSSRFLSDSFIENLNKQSPDLGEVFWNQSQIVSDLIESVYEKCPNDSRVLEAMSVMSDVINGEAKMMKAEDERLNGIIKAYLNSDEIGKASIAKLLGV